MSKVNMPYRFTQRFTFFICLIAAGCANNNFGNKSNYQRDCINGLIGKKDISGKIEYFFEHSLINMSDCPGANWSFRFSNKEAGAPYFRHLSLHPLNEKVEFKVVVQIDKVNNREIVLSQIKIRDHD